MMRAFWILCLIIFIVPCTGCTTNADMNDSNIREYKKCRDAGMLARMDGNGNVYCMTPEDSK